jgi:uncharacterized protein
MRTMDYVPRLIDAPLERYVRTFPCCLIVGPRACGKTTTSARVARSISRLDQPATASAFRADPDAALAARVAPALIDEWQDVPEVLGAVKRSVDADSSPGRFILTGSVSGDLDNASWPGTGRLVRLPMYGLTQREKLGLASPRPPARDLLQGRVRLPAESPNVVEYVDLALTSGFPEAMVLDEAVDRRTWLDSYIAQLVTRDVARLGGGRDAARIRRYLQAWALNSAGTVEDTTIYGAAGIDRRTHLAYEHLLQSIFVIDQVPAWTSNRLKRLALVPKRYMADVGLMAAAARINRGDILDDGNLLGRIIDTFVFTELRSQLAVDDEPTTLSHLRSAGGRHEVDLMVEFDGSRMVGIEIKATAAPTPDDARHLFWLRQELGDRFIGGVVFHTGPEILRFADDVVALPICALWGTSG